MDDSYVDVRDDDRSVLQALVEAGANLSEGRHVRHYLYLPSERAALECALELSGTGWAADVREPLGDSEEWSVVCEQSGLVLTPDAVLEGRELFDGLAESHAGEYDGWEASV